MCALVSNMHHPLGGCSKAQYRSQQSTASASNLEVPLQILLLLTASAEPLQGPCSSRWGCVAAALKPGVVLS